MSLTTRAQCPTPSATFDQGRYDFIAHRMQVSLIAGGLLGALFGMLLRIFTVRSPPDLLKDPTRCACHSFDDIGLHSYYTVCPSRFSTFIFPSILHSALSRRRGGRTQLTVIVLCLAVLGLFAPTTVYMATSFLSYQSRVILDLAWSGIELWFRVNGNMSVNVEGGFLRATQAEDSSLLRNSCARTAALTINVRDHLSPALFQYCIYSGALTSSSSTGGNRRRHYMLESMCYLAQKPRRTTHLRGLIASNVR